MSTTEDEAAEAALLRQMLELRRAGKTDEQIMQYLAEQELAGTGIDVPTDVPETLPRSGMESWGEWSQSEAAINLELCVEANTSGKAVRCTVEGGALNVHVDGDALIVGTLSEQVFGDPEWTLDVRSDGQRILCIELQKRRTAVDALAATALFRSLQVAGVEVGAPGLVAGVYLTEKKLGPSIEAQDGSYGSYDGTVPDQRGYAEGEGPDDLLPLL